MSRRRMSPSRRRRLVADALNIGAALLLVGIGVGGLWLAWLMQHA